MKKRIAGLVLLVLVMLLVGGGILLQRRSQEEARTREEQEASRITVTGYTGGEKIGFLEDEEVQDLLQKNYSLTVDYSRAGSLDMMTADMEGKDYLFPSSNIALEYYEELHGQPVQSEIVLNTPIVLYTRRIVADALQSQGIVSESGGVAYVDMIKLTELISSGTAWADIGLPELYGSVSVDTTDPVKSNSGNMFAALLANVLSEGGTVTEENVEEVLPKLQAIFGRLGYMETSSSDLFSQFLRMGVGAKPIIAGYESQLMEYAVQNPEEYEAEKEDLVMLYPVPTVWSSHVLIALDENGQVLLDALLDEEIQTLAWEKHGFRTGSGSQGREPAMDGVAQTITSVSPVPAYSVMRKIMEGLQ